MTNKLLRGLGVGGLVLVAASSCVSTNDPGTESTSNDSGKDGGDIQLALDSLPSAEVVDVDHNGIPTFVIGQLGRMAAIQSATKALSDLGPTMSTVGKVFRASAADLVLKSSHTDAEGDQHFRYTQMRDGLKVYGGELAIHVRDGAVLAANGSARADLPATKDAKIEAAEAIVHAKNDSSHVTASLAAAANPALAYKLGDGKLDMVYVVTVTGTQKDGTPVMDDVLVNAADGSIAQRIPRIHTAKVREMHDAKHTQTTPGTLVMTEGGTPSADKIVTDNYDRLGSVYDCYKNLFGRDSYDGKGAKLISSVHFDNNYVNAYWDGTQMVYGDGDGVQASNLAESMDVTAHELTHAVTERTSGLVYSGESGGLNEGMSDILGNSCEWYRDTAGDITKPGGANNFLVGEDVWTPGTAGDALRYMADPAKDGYSLDMWTTSTKTAEVHSSSGIANLAFYLMSQGGKHPRGKTTVAVTGIGIYKAAQVFYKANTSIMTSSSTFAAARTATEQAATQLNLTADEKVAVSNAWAAVGVGSPVSGGGGGNPPPPTGKVLANGVGTSTSGAAASQTVFTMDVPAGATKLSFAISGGTGDADMYVKFGAAPTTTSYDCRPYKSGNAEACPVAAAKTGTYYVMLVGYAAYSGTTLTGTFTTGGSQPPPQSTCAHSICTAGAKITDTACDPCVATLATKDSYCTTTAWDSQCVAEVASICKQTCP